MIYIYIYYVCDMCCTIYTHGMHVLPSRRLDSSVKVGRFVEKATMMTHQMKAWDERFTL